MTYYHPTLKSVAPYIARQGFLCLASIQKLEGRSRHFWSEDDLACRTLVFDSAEKATEWHIGAYGITPVIIAIDGDVQIEDSGNLHLLEGMLFLEGEIPGDQVSVYDAEATPVASM